MHIGLFSFVDSVDTLTSMAGTAADQGFDSLWIPQTFGLDTLTAIAIAGQQVPDITFATAVVPPTPGIRRCWPSRHSRSTASSVIVSSWASPFAQAGHRGELEHLVRQARPPHA